jgi:hypothetical protein
VCKVTEVVRLLDEKIGHLGRLDILVNNAGSLANRSPAEVTEEEYDRLFDVNVKGVFFACQQAARQTISILPPGSNFCSEFLVSTDMRFAYAGNQLHDSIGIFSVGPDGDLTYVGEEWTRGDYPRSFNFDPAGQFLYCCNQRGDNIAAFRVDRQTGGIKFTGHYTPVGNPSSIVFLDLARVS